MNKVVVIGSLNIDVIQKMSRLPRQGETLGMIDQSTNFGGKGANQAVAAARQGAQVAFVGAVGDDGRGQSYIDLLNEEGVDTQNITIKNDTATGTAYIMLEEDGHNTILVYGGANQELTVADVEAARDVLLDADVVVAQLEVPQAAILAGFKIAHENGAMTLLNPAPVTNHVDPELLAQTDLLVPNETEAAALLEAEATTEAAELAESMVRFENELGIKQVMVTLGSDGSFYHVNGKNGVVPSFKVKAIDTTAAGDTFIGSVATILQPDFSDVENVIRRASFASSLVVSRPGAIPAIPFKQEIEDGLKEQA